jgi:DNA-directed RNA polymerase, mitochondrial
MLQSTLNRQMVEEGRTRYWNTVTEAKAREEEASTRYGQRLLASSVVPVATALREWLAALQSKKAVQRGAAHAPLSAVSPDVAAFIAIRSVLDCIGMCKAYTPSCKQIGSLVEDELRFAYLKKNHPGLFRKLEKQLLRCHSYDHKRKVILHTMRKHNVGVGEFVEWEEGLLVKVGSVLVDLIQKHTGLVEAVSVRTGKKTQYQLQATAATTEWIRRYNDYAEILDPVWMPTIEPPIPWASGDSGGYDKEDLPMLYLVKRASGHYIENHLAKANMPDVYAAVNALQATPWAINRKVHGVIQHFWSLGRCVGGLPQADDDELPEKPADISTNKEALKAWKGKAARVHVSNVALRSVRLQARKLLNLAQKFSNVPQFYFPYQLDFRGRVYTTPTFLTPQGSDLARSLLTFAEGVPMWDEADAFWLAVYGANLFGKDKVTFEERVEWVKANRENILAVGKDPIGNQWWQDAEEPWQFLAWCMEWSGWLTVGAGFQTRLPVCLDGTNNGLQILSMLTRDEVAAKATNVLPGSTPADIYADVAARVIELMREATGEDKPLADHWLAFVINRKTTKRPVMVLPYGGTFHSCREYVSQWYAETAKSRGVELPDFVVMAKQVHYLATKIWEAIDVCVGRPRQAMSWLQQCAQVFSKLNLPVVWTAPTGFPVLQAYKDSKISRVATTLGDCVRTIQLRTDHPTKLSASKQKNGISPNFVHSLDAAALVTTVALCLKYDIKAFAMIHDSYGTHSPRVHEMASALRTAFVTTFSPDRLSMLRDELQSQLVAAGHPEAVLPAIPEFGSLEVSRLHESEFFFA